MKTRRCIICGSDMAGRHPNAATCSPACRREKQRQWRASNLDKVRAYNREWQARWRRANPDVARERNRRAKIERRAALLAVQGVLGSHLRERVGARRDGPAKSIDHDLIQARDRDRLCLCCGKDIGHRPPRTKVCSSPECHRERARIRAAEYRWGNIDAVRAKERAKAARDPNNKARAKAWHETHRQEVIHRRRRHYESNRVAILGQQKDAYAHEMAALSVIKELLHKGASNEARKSE